MFKRFLSVVAGFIVASVVILLIEEMGHRVYPMPPGTDFNNAESIKTLMTSMPIGAYLFILAAYVVGSFTGGITSTLISGRTSATPAIITGCVVMAAGVVNIMMIPGQPMWFIVACQLVYIPLAYAGFVLSRKRSSSESQ